MEEGRERRGGNHDRWEGFVIDTEGVVTAGGAVIDTGGVVTGGGS